MKIKLCIMSNREFPILFSTPMVQAILEGRKTQTRRIKMPRSGGLIATTGDILWVRETWRPTMFSMLIGWPYDYKATAKEDGAPEEGPWKSSIFMPKDACRIRLEITAIRQEPLLNISEFDAIAEGMTEMKDTGDAGKDYMILEEGPFRLPFALLWDKINAKRGFGWYKNPDVWVITFKRIKNE
jgi:hypothetical protein